MIYFFFGSSPSLELLYSLSHHCFEYESFFFFGGMAADNKPTKCPFSACHQNVFLSKSLISNYKVLISLRLSLCLSLSEGQELVGDGGGGSGFRGGWAAWLDTVTCERPESGESTGSRVRTQKAREGLSGGGRGDWRGEATLGTKADSADTSHPLRVRLSLAPWGTLHSSESCSPRAEATETLNILSRKWPLTHIELISDLFSPSYQPWSNINRLQPDYLFRLWNAGSLYFTHYKTDFHPVTPWFGI